MNTALTIIGLAMFIFIIVFSLKSAKEKRKAQQEEHEKIKEYGESINEETRNKDKWKKKNYGFRLGFNDAVIDSAILFILLPVIVPGISLTARRLHDFNQSGWMQCIFIPGFIADEFLGTGYVIYIVTLAIWAIYCSQGATKGKNRFGLKPKK